MSVPRLMHAVGFKRSGVLSVAAALLLGVVAGCKPKGQPPGAAMPARPPAMVTAAPVVAQDVPVYLDEIGRAVSMESVTIVPQVGGKLMSVHFEDGAFVKKGQLLFEIDPRPFEAALASTEAALQQNKATLELAKVEFNRFQEALESSAVSKLQFEQKRSAVSVAEAQVAASEAAIKTAKLNVEYSKIFSPINGRTGARMVDPGNVVRENSTQMLVLQRIDPIYAEFNITEKDLGLLRECVLAAGMNLAQSTGPSLKVMVTDPGNEQRSAGTATAAASAPAGAASQPTGELPMREGALTFLDNAVQSSTGTVRLRATVPNEDGLFWPGQFVKCRLVLSVKKDAALIPAEAQQIGQMGPFVYVVSPEQTALLRPIQPGQRQGKMLVVQTGLAPGEQVIVTGHMAVMPGGKVMVVPPGGMPPGMGPPGMAAPGGGPPGSGGPPAGGSPGAAGQPAQKQARAK